MNASALSLAVASFKADVYAAAVADKAAGTAGAALVKALFPVVPKKAAEKKAAAAAAAAALNAADWAGFWSEYALAVGCKDKKGKPALGKAVNRSPLQSAMRAAGFNIGMKNGVFSVDVAKKKKKKSAEAVSLVDSLAALIAEHGAEAVRAALGEAEKKAAEAAEAAAEAA